jgi:hypothetical protein
MPRPPSPVTRHSSPIWVLLSVFYILLLAFFLRFHLITQQSYWNDEGNSRVLASRDVPTIIRNAAADVHPPGYYILLKFWRDAAGENELALRGLSAFFGVLLVAVVYRMGREWFGRWAGVGAALFAAVNPFLIYYAQEARMYSQLALMGALSFWMFYKVRELENWRINWVIGYWLFTALGLYTQYAFAFVIIAQLLLVILDLGTTLFNHPIAQSLNHPIKNLKSQISNSLLLFTMPFLLFLPWLPTAVRHLGWPAERAFPPDALSELVRYLAFGRTIETEAVSLGLLAVGAVVLFALSQNGFTPNFRAALVWWLVPAGLAVWQGFINDTFAKVLVVAVPPLCLIFGAAVEAAFPIKARTAFLSLVATFFMGSVLFFTYQSLNNLYFNPAYFRDDYRGIARYIQSLEREGDAVITNAPNQVEAFAYYFPDEARLFPLPSTRPLDPAHTQAQLENIAANYTRLFVIYWGDQQADPEKFIESWLNANTFKAREQWFGQVRLAVYAAARPATQPTTRTNASFGEKVQLPGYALSATSAAPGDILQITFFWNAAQKLEKRYKVFVHLYADVNAPPVAQTDSEPGGGLALTTTWEPGRAVPDNHGLFLPPDLPSGPYRLMAGLYDLETGERLPVTVGDTISGDRLDLGLVVVKP